MKKQILCFAIVLVIVGAFIGVLHFTKSINGLSATGIRSDITSPSLIDSTVTKEGILKMYHADDFVNKKSTDTYVIQASDETETEIVFPPNEKIDENLLDATVKVTGTQNKNIITLSSINEKNLSIIKTAPVSVSQQKSAQSPITKKVAVILFNFQNDTSQTYSAIDAKKMVFTDPSTVATSVNGYFKEESYGKLQLGGSIDPAGDVFGWYTLNQNNSPCNYQYWRTEADQFASADGYIPTDYFAVVYVFPITNACPWGGKALFSSSTVPRPTYINSGWYGTIVHELGHTFNLAHSNAISCSGPTGLPVTLSRNCTNIEYGDPFDIMANATLKHFNNGQKDLLNFFSGYQTKDITASGTYDIYPLETPNNPLTLRIPIESNAVGENIKYYYLEFRKKYGVYDDFLITEPVVNGVTIRFVDKHAYTFKDATHIIDTNPATSTFSDAPLAVGQTFTDNERGISITTTSININPAGSKPIPKATVQIVINGQPWNCVRPGPAVSISPSSFSGHADQNHLLSVTVTNNNTPQCPPELYERIYSGVLAFTYQPNQFLLSSGQSVSFTDTLQSDPCQSPSSHIVNTLIRAKTPYKGTYVSQSGAPLSYTVTPFGPGQSNPCTVK